MRGVKKLKSRKLFVDQSPPVIGRMDALKRPLHIPPDFSKYAEEKHLFELYERMVAELLVARPEDPLTYLHEFLSQKKDDGTVVSVLL